MKHLTNRNNNVLTTIHLIDILNFHSILWSMLLLYQILPNLSSHFLKIDSECKIKGTDKISVPILPAISNSYGRSISISAFPCPMLLAMAGLTISAFHMPVIPAKQTDASRATSCSTVLIYFFIVHIDQHS